MGHNRIIAPLRHAKRLVYSYLSWHVPQFDGFSGRRAAQIATSVSSSQQRDILALDPLLQFSLLGTTMNRRIRRPKRKLLFAAALLVISLMILPAYVGAYNLSGTSGAPTLLLGDRVWVNRAAYDIRIPYLDRVLVNRTGPALGDLVQVESPDNGHFIFKRVAAVPGDRVAMQAHHLSINGRPLTYETVDNTPFAAVPRENQIGSVIELERLGSHNHFITYTPDSTESSFSEVLVPADHYFLIGDNRDQSRDSRAWGPIPRKNFRGRVFLQPHRG